MPRAPDTETSPQLIGSIAGVYCGSEITVETVNPHGLHDGDEVKIKGVLGIVAANGTFFVRATDRQNNHFNLFSDTALTKPVVGQDTYEGGGTVLRPLTADYAILVGINNYSGFKCLTGPEADAERFR